MDAPVRQLVDVRVLLVGPDGTLPADDLDRVVEERLVGQGELGRWVVESAAVTERRPVAEVRRFVATFTVSAALDPDAPITPDDVAKALRNITQLQVGVGPFRSVGINVVDVTELDNRHHVGRP